MRERFRRRSFRSCRFRSTVAGFEGLSRSGITTVKQRHDMFSLPFHCDDMWMSVGGGHRSLALRKRPLRMQRPSGDLGHSDGLFNNRALSYEHRDCFWLHAPQSAPSLKRYADPHIRVVVSCQFRESVPIPLLHKTRQQSGTRAGVAFLCRSCLYSYDLVSQFKTGAL